MSAWSLHHDRIEGWGDGVGGCLRGLCFTVKFEAQKSPCLEVLDVAGDAVIEENALEIRDDTEEK